MLRRMNAHIHDEFIYVARHEKGTQTPVETLSKQQGSCRDFAVLMIEAARALGFAARFVSGYLYNPTRHTPLVGGGNTHAWVRIFLPGSGWVEFDPTNGIVGNRGLIRVAVARDPRQATLSRAPWRGFPSYNRGMSVAVVVLPPRRGGRRVEASNRRPQPQRRARPTQEPPRDRPHDGRRSGEPYANSCRYEIALQCAAPIRAGLTQRARIACRGLVSTAEVTRYLPTDASFGMRSSTRHAPHGSVGILKLRATRDSRRKRARADRRRAEVPSTSSDSGSSASRSRTRDHSCLAPSLSEARRAAIHAFKRSPATCRANHVPRFASPRARPAVLRDRRGLLPYFVHLAVTFVAA